MGREFQVSALTMLFHFAKEPTSCKKKLRICIVKWWDTEKNVISTARHFWLILDLFILSFQRFRKPCMYKGIEYEHNSLFQDDCNEALCRMGKVIFFTNKLCPEVEIEVMTGRFTYNFVHDWVLPCVSMQHVFWDIAMLHRYTHSRLRLNSAQ